MSTARRTFAVLIAACALSGYGLAAAALAADQPAADAHAIAQAYADQTRRWRNPEQVHAWIARNFTYDRARAIALSETQRSRGAPFRIYETAEFYQRPSGICVDVSRFAVETLRKIAPTSEPKYLLIKFDPIRIKGNVLRMHWLASYRKNGKYYFFADSHHPQVLSGPHDDVADFVKSYQDVRKRTIVSYRLVDTFRKQRRKMRQKRAGDQSGKRIHRQ